jgi:protein LTV1
MVLNPTQLPNGAAKVKQLGDLASEFGSDTQSIRDNEGEAAEYGVYFDDSEYDYMQHLRDIGNGTGDAVFVEANPVANKGKGKQKESLEDALRQLDLENKSGDLLEEDMLPSKNLQRLTYQSQQDVPDAIAGFQPDMDPRLREVLEALEDEAYVDDDDDIFQELAKDSQELSSYEFDETYDEYEDDEEGWESDHTAKPTNEFKTTGGPGDEEAPQLVDTTSTLPSEGPSQEWMDDFMKFKKDQKTEKKAAAAAAPSELQSSLWTTTTNGGQKKKRKGALTNPSAYSMTSSSLVRTEQLGILDVRFEKMEEEYNADMDMDDMSSVSGVSTASAVTGPTRADFDGMLDDFLGSYSSNGKKRSKEGKWKSGVEQLDEIRKGLGPARLRTKSRS